MIFKKIIEKLNSKLNDYGTCIILDSSNLVKLDKKSFYSIADKKTKKIGFVDGGNAEIIGGANFSLQLIRIYAVVFEEDKRVKQNKQEFYLLITAKSSKDKIVYETEAFNTYLRLDKEFDAFDKELSEPGHKAEPGRIAESARKISEYKIAQELLNDLDSGDLLIRDGDLIEGTTTERKQIEELKEKSIAKGVVVAGLSKTTSLLTDSGNSAAAVLNKIGPECAWYYPATNNTGFVKLNKNSNYVFRLDFFIPDKLADVLGGLKANSRDACFLGYPYGLIDADRFARVSTKEKERLKLVLMSKGGEHFRAHLASIDAHEILNKVV
ncbi:DNA double-strand break repair nuclease NurA [Candidatus Woesearchaeota archaeon]|nr:DNA double-strand break repair nuclease NurA [Candidatus Woesearchaeota archaeon]